MKPNLIAAAFLAGTFLTPLAALAASTEWIVQDGARIRLVAAEPAAGDTEIRAALQVELTPGWKTYWRDPGDAGVPPQIDFSGTAGLVSFTIDYPAPERFVDGNGSSIGYKHPVAFPLTLRLTDAGQLIELNAKAFLGICEEICLPVQAEFKLAVPRAAASTPDQALVAGFFGALPGKPEKGLEVVSVQAADKAVRVDIGKAAADAEIYLAADGFMFGTPKREASPGSEAAFLVPIVFAPKNANLSAADISYTLKIGGRAVSGLARVAAP